MDLPYFHHTSSDSLRLSVAKPAQELIHLIFDNEGVDDAYAIHCNGSIDVTNGCVTRFSFYGETVSASKYAWVPSWYNRHINTDAIQRFACSCIKRSIEAHLHNITRKYNLLSSLYKMTSHVDVVSPTVFFDGQTLALENPEKLKPDFRRKVETALCRIDTQQAMRTELNDTFTFASLLGVAPHEINARSNAEGRGSKLPRNLF